MSDATPTGAENDATPTNAENEVAPAGFGRTVADWASMALVAAGSMAILSSGWGSRPYGRAARDERWRQAADDARDFQLRMGYQRAADKTRFLRQHYGFMAGSGR